MRISDGSSDVCSSDLTLKPVMPQHGADVEWICVTDGAPHPDAEAAEGWTLVCEPHNGVHPNRAAKRAKFAPGEYTAASCSIWVDARSEERRVGKGGVSTVQLWWSADY